MNSEASANDTEKQTIMLKYIHALFPMNPLCVCVCVSNLNPAWE